MSVDLYTLAYFSRNLVADDGKLAVELDHILEVSRRHNADNDITGALLISDGWFAQVLEGPQLAVEELFEQIVRDRRHDDIRVLYLREIDKRSFGSWSMAFAGSVDAAELAERGSVVTQVPTQTDQPGIGHHLVSVLQKLIGEAAPKEADAGEATVAAPG